MILAVEEPNIDGFQSYCGHYVRYVTTTDFWHCFRHGFRTTFWYEVLQTRYIGKEAKVYCVYNANRNATFYALYASDIPSAFLWSPS